VIYAALGFGSPVHAGPTLTPNGVVCNSADSGINTFSFNELSPSRLGANATRLGTIQRLEDYYTAVHELCLRQGLPGCERVEAWRANRRLNPWPTRQDPDYLSKRAWLLQHDDDMLVEATRVLAHDTCQRSTPKYSAACTALVAAEEALSLDVASRIDDCVSTAPKASPDDKRQQRAASFYGSYATWTAKRTVCAANSASALRAWANDPKKKELDKAQQKAKDDEDAAQAAAVAAPDSPAAKSARVKAGQSAKAVADLNASFATNAKKKAADVAASAMVLPRASDRYAWQPASAALGTAASAVPVVVDVNTLTCNGATDDGACQEQEQLQYNMAACQRASFYVSPDRQLVRHDLDVPVRSPFTVCIDTSGFAVDQPVQLTVKTPRAQRIYRLWPGEPLAVDLEAVPGEVQVAHLAFSGYPRREVLRALTRKLPNGANAYSLLASQNAVVPAASGLDDLAKKLTKDPVFSRSMSDLSDAIAAYDPKRTQTAIELRKLTDKAYLSFRTAVTAEPAYADPSAQKALNALFPPATDDPAHKDDPVTSLAKSAGDVLAIAKTLGAFLSNVNAILLAQKSSAQTSESAQQTIEQAARTLCQLTGEIVPLVTEDVLVQGPGTARPSPDPYILQYDYAGGFQRTSRPRPLHDDDMVFVEVQSVPPGWSIGAAIDNRSVLQRNTGIVGLSQSDTTTFPFSARDSASAPGFNTLRPLDPEIQAASTQIIALGMLSGSARYSFQVCASSSPTDDCTGPAPAPGSALNASAPKPAPDSSRPPADPTESPASNKSTPTPPAAPGADGATPSPKGSPDAPAPSAPAAVHRTIALNSLSVHSYKHLGVRAGIGVSEAFAVNDRDRDLVAIAGSSASGVRSRGAETNVGVPILVTYYGGEGRDAIDLPHQPHWGIAGGIDVLNAFTNPRLYAGVVYDVYGFGFTGAASMGSVPTVDNPAGSVVAPSAVQHDTVWIPGVFLGVTTDLDIFEAIFSAYLSPNKLPSVTPSSDKTGSSK
jgi:hypothetical protein